MFDIFIDSLFDSLKACCVVFLLYILISFVERMVSKKLTLKSKLSPVYGALIGLIPQCGFSIVSADLYKKRHVTMGTLISVFIACSDEAIPLFMSEPDHFIIVIPIIILKFVYAVLIGYFVDLIFKNKINDTINHHLNCHHDEEKHKGCCNHNIELDGRNGEWLHNHLIHPFIHTLKIFIFIFAINMIFGLMIYFLTENLIIEFLTSNKILTPIFSSLIGLIPNCASSVILTKLYFANGLEFGALFSGLCCNAGLGLVYIFKGKELKENLTILSILLLSSIFIGYILILLI